MEHIPRLQKEFDHKGYHIVVYKIVRDKFCGGETYGVIRKHASNKMI